MQIGLTALGFGEGALWPVAAGLAVFATVAGVQLVRFRRRNGVWLGGFASRVVLGTATPASVAYAIALAAAIWAADDARWWLVALWSAAGGAGYALGGRRWLRTLPRGAGRPWARGVGGVARALRRRGGRRRRAARRRRLMAELDAHIVAPARLKLMTTLTAVSEAEFATVRDALEVSDSVLSKHLAALEDAGYVRRRKGVHRGGARPGSR